MPQTGSFTAVAELEMLSFMRSRDSGRGILATNRLEEPSRASWFALVAQASILDYGPSCFDPACPNREAGDCCIFKDE
jgi:hypothetical protein